MLHGHDNIEMDTSRGYVAILKNTHDMCVRHTCRTCFVHETASL